MDLNSLLALARQTTNVHQILRTQLLWMLALRIILYTLLLVISYVFSGGPFDVIVLPENLLVIFILTVYITTLFSAFYLQIFRGNLRKFGFIQTLIDTLFVSVLVFFSGGSNSVFTTVYFFPIISGGLILPRKGGLVAAAAATLQYGAILYLETRGLYPSYLDGNQQLMGPTPSVVVLNHFAVHGLTFFLAAILSALFGLRLQKTEIALSDSLRNFDQLAILYKQVFDNISTGIMTIDGTNKITSANNAIHKITSIKPQSLIDRDLSTAFPNFDLSQINSRMAADFTKTDGSTVRIGYSNMLIQQSTEELQANQPSHKIITLQDISELEKLERQVRQAEKLAAIGTMSASIAHDFRNPLTAISGSAQILASEFSSGGTKHHADLELVNIILRESSRLIVTIADFLKFSRPEHANCTWFSLRSCLEEVLQMCKADPAWPTSCQIRFNFKDTIDVWADETQIFTVFTHLIQNALAFCPAGKEIIEITAREQNQPGSPDSIEIIFNDNGPGVDESMREHIFEPFYTSRPEGTGLGLAVTKQAVEAHCGSIKAIKGRNGGAEFILVLPLPQ